MELGFGVVAALDVLGFKAIRTHRSVTDVLRSLKDAERALRDRQPSAALFNEIARQHASPDADSPFECDFQVHFLSDSALIVAWARKEPGDTELGTARKGFMVDRVVRATASLLTDGADGPCPLLHRGAIAAGPLVVDQHYFIGEAIDDAASAMNLPHGWFVPLTSNAARLVERLPAWVFPRPDEFLVEYPVPRKDRGAEIAHVVNPLAYTRDIQRARAAVEGFMVGDVRDVQEKRANTLAFLEHVAREPS